MNTPSDLADLLTQLDKTLRGNKDSPGTFASTDLAAAMGVSGGRATRIVRSMIHVGLVEYAGKAKRPSMAGVMTPVPVYRRVKKAKGR